MPPAQAVNDLSDTGKPHEWGCPDGRLLEEVGGATARFSGLGGIRQVVYGLGERVAKIANRMMLSPWGTN